MNGKSLEQDGFLLRQLRSLKIQRAEDRIYTYLI
ncbi:hypothetical protein T12_5184 [Trichinella patagoniensis]|uniref:Uncharacterized protein n=1 Tax=Trichinella patagoniensis TaxID=990121 RepID=A0A0V0W8N2_9BILA|nr:hypothetical protein T12_5184 [Trichinella patagoniensis]